MHIFFRVVSILVFLLSLVSISKFIPYTYAFPQSTFHELEAAEEMNEHQEIPTSTPIYFIKGDELEMQARFTYVYFKDDELMGLKLYLAVDITSDADNGYTLIHEDDVDSWIAYYGQYATSGFVDHIKAITPKVFVEVEGDDILFYNHARIVANAGGGPGTPGKEKQPNGNWRGIVTDVKRYDTDFKHSINMTMPSSAVVGESVTIDLETTDGSIWIMQQQYWNLVVATPSGGSDPILTNHRVSPDPVTHEAEHSITHVFTEPGTYTVRFIIEDATYHNNPRTETERYSVEQEITIEPGKEDEDDDDDPPPTPDPGPCTMSISSPTNGQLISAESLNPNATGMIRADMRGSERFDVLQGIPTSESLYANVFGLSYLHKNDYREKTGKITYSVPVKKTYILTWTEIFPQPCPECPPIPPMPREQPVIVQENITVERDYTYWQIENLEIYSLAQATMSNYALPGGSVILNPTGYTPPSFTVQHSDSVTDHVQPAPCQAVYLGSEIVPGGNAPPPTPNEPALFKSQAEASIGQVKLV